MFVYLNISDLSQYKVGLMILLLRRSLLLIGIKQEVNNMTAQY